MNPLFVFFVFLLSLIVILGKFQNEDLLYERVQVVGLSSLNEEQFSRYLRDHPLYELVRRDVRDLSRDLKNLLPVKKVTVERRPWERLLRIEIEERQPFLSFLTDGSKALLVDEEGNPVSLRLDPEMILWDRPILRGCKPATPPPSSLDSQDAVTRIVDLFCLKNLVAFSRLIAEEAPEEFDAMSEIVGEKKEIYVIHSSGVILYFYPYSYLTQLRGMIFALPRIENLGYRVHSIQVPRPNTAIIQEKTDLVTHKARRNDHEA
jgi:hypothetical protein